MKRMLWCVLAILAGTAGAAAGQESPAGGPMTYALARKANYVPLETLRETRSRIPAPLARRVTIEREGVLLQQVLLDIANQAELGLSYGEDLVRARVVVSLSAKNETAADVLQQVTDGTDWAVLVTPAGQVAVLRREAAPVGAIVGRVTGAKTGTAIVGATVLIEGTSRSTATGSDGTYRFAEVVPGTYTVRARFIGYAPGSASVTVEADQEATADFALEKSAQLLDEIVTTGTMVPTEVKALPTPISVISAVDIARQHPHTVSELFRQAVPGAVSWDIASSPGSTQFSVRGSNSLTSSFVTPQMKVFIDGIETALSTVSAVDPSSIERVEVIRGPQAGAIYGSDALGGVVQIFTKRGDPDLNRPQVDAEAALGLIQTPYTGYGGVLRHGYKASVRGGSADVSFNVGASYSHTADWIPNGEISAQSNPSIYGGVHVTRGIVALDVSGRHYIQNQPGLFNPDLTKTGFSFFSKPEYQPNQYQNQTLGARLSLTPMPWWHHTVSVGLDRWTFDLTQVQPRLTFPGDTMLLVSNQNRTKTSISYNSAVEGPLSSALSGSLLVGFDHWSLPVNSFFAFNALNLTGAVQVGPGGFLSATRTVTNNTGYFGQAQLGFRDALFLTVGLRAEQNSDFGDSLSTPLLPRVGISYAQPVGEAILKFRGSWGRAIRAPTPGTKQFVPTANGVILANPTLGPERQGGWDTGIDVAFGSRASLSATYYHQTADDLIQEVLVQANPTLTYQFQNVGRVKNTGLELEGTLDLGRLELKGQYGYARASIAQLAPGYTGDLRVGDQSFQTPKNTAGAALAIHPLRTTTVTGGFTYVGRWTDYDYFAYFSCLGGTGPCRNTTFALNRDYLTEYPSFAKVNASVAQQLTPFVSAYVAMDNLTNNQSATEWFATFPVMGRITTVGLNFHY